MKNNNLKKLIIIAALSICYPNILMSMNAYNILKEDNEDKKEQEIQEIEREERRKKIKESFSLVKENNAEIDFVRLKKTFDGRDQDIRLVAISPQGEFIGTVLNNGTINIWDYETGESKNHLEDLTIVITAVSPDRKFVVIPSSQGTAIYDLETEKCMFTFFGSSHQALSSDGKFIAIFSDDKIKVWEIIKHDDFITQPKKNNLASDVNVFYEKN